MKLIEYYKDKQTSQEWVDKFQSTGKNSCGKLFSCLNVNFRNLISFFNQLEAFKPKDGLRRDDWNSYQDNGQEKDKHRIVNLKNAGLIRMDGDRYYITDKGHEVLRISNDKNLTDREKWIILLMLILDYNTEERKQDLIKSVLELDSSLKQHGLETVKFLAMLKNSLYIDKKDKLFQSDVFWLITFAKDEQFDKIYLDSTEDEKQNLFDYVLLVSQNKKSTDLIAHKFVSGGAYSVSTFNDDINMIFSILILISLRDVNWDNYIDIICKCYSTCNAERIKKFMSSNSLIYQMSYDQSFGQINKLMAKGGI